MSAGQLERIGQIGRQLVNQLLAGPLGRWYNQARTIWRVATGAAGSRKNEALDLFLAGQSVQKVSALLMPGIGGPELVRRQLDIQDDLRSYTLAREKEIADLKDEIAELRAALNEAMKAIPAQAPAELLGELLGLQA